MQGKKRQQAGKDERKEEKRKKKEEREGIGSGGTVTKGRYFPLRLLSVAVSVHGQREGAVTYEGGRSDTPVTQEGRDPDCGDSLTPPEG